MTSSSYSFDRFVLDPANRLLSCDATPVELNARYLDALMLLVREQGRLVPKDRFMKEVWRGVPVTDEALTQCIRTLRRQLGDDAASPRFIATVPKHGYRFIAPVANGERRGDHRRSGRPAWSWPEFFLLGGAGTAGGGLAGLVGGLLYGFAGAPAAGSVGAISVLLVVASVTVLVALLGAAGVSFGIAAAGLISRRPWGWSALGGAVGGLLVGAGVKLIGLDAFELLLGRSPGDITGAGEGALLGAAIGLGGWLGSRLASAGSLVRSAALAGLAGGAAGAFIPLLGGNMLGGSLDLLAHRFPDSRLRLDQIGVLLGERDFGSMSQTVTGGFEGLLFGSCLVGAMILAQRRIAAGAHP